jgi:membrane protein DedA with SNARE-associated domain
MDLAPLVRALAEAPPATFVVAVAAAAFVEYVFPPFPGDAAVVAGTAVAVVGDGSVPALLAATTAGAMLGAVVDLAVGRRLARTAWRERLGPARAADVERLLAAFARWGAWALLANRFVPGIRALFFVAAGVAGVRTAPALLAAAGSALAWNALLVGAGTWVGWNLDALSTWLARWSGLVGVGLAVGAALAIARWRRAGDAAPGGRLGPPEGP